MGLLEELSKSGKPLIGYREYMCLHVYMILDLDEPPIGQNRRHVILMGGQRSTFRVLNMAWLTLLIQLRQENQGLDPRCQEEIAQNLSRHEILNFSHLSRIIFVNETDRQKTPPLHSPPSRVRLAYLLPSMTPISHAKPNKSRERKKKVDRHPHTP